MGRMEANPDFSAPIIVSFCPSSLRRIVSACNSSSSSLSLSAESVSPEAGLKDSAKSRKSLIDVRTALAASLITLEIGIALPDDFSNNGTTCNSRFSMAKRTRPNFSKRSFPSVRASGYHKLG